MLTLQRSEEVRSGQSGETLITRSFREVAGEPPAHEAKAGEIFRDTESPAHSEDHFHTRLLEETHRAAGANGAVAIMIIQFDRLKALEHSYGKQHVADFLVQAAGFLRENLGRLDVVSHFGKSGFAVILPATGSASLLIRERLLGQIAVWTNEHLKLGGRVTVRIGTASAPNDGQTPRQLLIAALPERCAVA